MMMVSIRAGISSGRPRRRRVPKAATMAKTTGDREINVRSGLQKKTSSSRTTAGATINSSLPKV